ncbi:hypothetical protein QAD02_007969 [Eretmocerus hayati]|uniref:Uncharacterized protein n=1 Tax=Eretmocerus hayati TaxID=131215 RepID=A0ACC2N5G1_9HYME|nr:hypothetical protein QAD02_007969 [Eretmocerus hayati]
MRRQAFDDHAVLTNHYTAKMVLDWIQEYDGSTDVEAFMKQMQRALDELQSKEEKEHLVFSVLAKKLRGRVQILVNRYKVDDLYSLAECLRVHYGVQERDHDQLTEERNHVRQKINETVEAYSRRYLGMDRKYR